MDTETRITSDSIIRDSLKQQVSIEKPKQTIEDLEELRSLQLTKRKEYEQQLNKNRLNFGQWMRYAKWEIDFCHDFKRARSIYERALQVNVEHVPFWIHYIKFELSHNNVNHGRNILDRAIATLPRIDKFWYLYVQTEETLQNYDKVRHLFKAWMNWNPPAGAWDAYVHFEQRYEETDNVRDVFKRYVVKYPLGTVWLSWIDFEQATGDIVLTRNVFELAIDSLLEKNAEDSSLALIIEKWAVWEFKHEETQRANEIFRIVLDKSKFSFSSHQYQNLLEAFTNFDSKFGGNNETSSSNVSLKRKLKYISSIEASPQDIDSWFLLFDLVHGEELVKYFEQAILPQNVPKDQIKTLVWRRYIFIWIKYALYAEFELKNTEKSREIWLGCLNVIPKAIIFGKVWIMYTEFEIRNSPETINKARKVLGRCIGQMSTPKDKVFKYYIELERKLGEWDRIRKIYEKWFELSLINDFKGLKVLLEYIEFEKDLREFERCEALFNVGLNLIRNDIISNRLTPYDYLYMSFINYYKDQFEYEAARHLFQKVLDDNDNVKVWISMANFESSIPNDTQLDQFNQNNDDEFVFELEDVQKENTRAVFTRALDHYKAIKQDEERLIILEAWSTYEQLNGDSESVAKVSNKMPDIIKRTKQEDGITKEYLEYVFPDDEQTVQPNFNKFLENAKKWAQK